MINYSFPIFLCFRTLLSSLFSSNFSVAAKIARSWTPPRLNSVLMNIWWSNEIIWKCRLSDVWKVPVQCVFVTWNFMATLIPTINPIKIKDQVKWKIKRVQNKGNLRCYTILSKTYLPLLRFQKCHLHLHNVELFPKSSLKKWCHRPYLTFRSTHRQ